MKVYKCPLCTKKDNKYSSLHRFIRHLRKYHPTSTSLPSRVTTESSLVCTDCKEECASCQEFIQHMETHLPGKILQCALCNSFTTKGGFAILEIHMRRHTGEKPYRCNYEDCEYETSAKKYLTDHIKFHAVDKTFNCKLCDYRATVLCQLRSHERTHSDKKPFVCKLCGYRCKWNTALRAHERTHIKPEDKPFKCQFCEFRANRRERVKQHEIIRHQTEPRERLFKCQHSNCNYSTFTAQILRHHENGHIGHKKPFKCPQCESYFGNKQSLTWHIVTHTDHKPFKCSQCDYRANRRHHLQCHERTHSGLKPFKCSQCDYRAAVKSSVTSHELTHSDTKGFPCTFCPFKARQPSGLRGHLKYMHSKRTQGKLEDIGTSSSNRVHQLNPYVSVKKLSVQDIQDATTLYNRDL